MDELYETLFEQEQGSCYLSLDWEKIFAKL